MSTDNGIYVGSFPILGGKEYRVIEGMAIDNLDYGTIEEQDNTRVCYFGAAKIFATEEEAMKEATRKYKECMSGYGVCEYGICLIDMDRPLINKTVIEADAWLKERWDASHPTSNGK